MNQNDRDFIIQTIERLINAPIRTLTNAEIARLKGLIKKIWLQLNMNLITVLSPSLIMKERVMLYSAI